MLWSPSPLLGNLWDVPTAGRNHVTTPDLSASWSTTRATRTVRGGAIGPNQRINSARMTENGSVGTHYIQYSPSLVTTTAPCIARIFARAVSGSPATRGLLFNVYDIGFTSLVSMYCNLRSGSQPSAAGVILGSNFTSAYGRVVAHANSWFECVLVFVPVNGISLMVVPQMTDATLTTASYSGDGASSIDLAEASVRVQ